MSDMKLTRRGFDLLARALGGQQLTFTKVEFGDSKVDGEIIQPTDTEAYDFTHLIHKRDIELPLVECTPSGGGEVLITFMIDNANLTEGFFMREVGLYAQIQDETPLLYAYLNQGLQSSYLPSAHDELWKMLMTLAVTIEQAQNVTAILDASLAFITRSDFLEHINSSNPHPNLVQVKEPVSSAQDVWVPDDDNHLHKLPVTKLADLILNSSRGSYEGRLSQAETNIANLFMQLDVESVLGLKANLLLAEDFIDLDCVDTFKRKVLVAAEGVDDLTLESLDGIIEGAVYILTDGIRSEEVQIKAAVQNTGAYLVTLTAPLAQTYDLNSTYLLRTTATLSNGSAYGAADILTRQFLFDDIWKGLGADEATTLTLNTTQANANAFVLEGPCAFTADGSFTIGG